jgi:hypothetical protein
LSYLLTDEAYAVAILHYNADSSPENKHWYFLARADALDGLANQHGGRHFPRSANPGGLGVGFHPGADLYCPGLPGHPRQADFIGSAFGGVTSILAAGLPYKLGLVTAALVGILVGLLTERKA